MTPVRRTLKKDSRLVENKKRRVAEEKKRIAEEKKRKTTTLTTLTSIFF